MSLLYVLSCVLVDVGVKCGVSVYIWWFLLC